MAVIIFVICVSCAAVSSCYVLRCPKRTRKGIKVFMARLPRNPERKKVWIANIGKGNWKSTTDLYVCETHFANEMWKQVRVDGKKKLKGNAMPTIFPAQELQKEKLPLSCECTLRRKLESIQFQEGICDDIFKLLKDEVAQFKDVRERDCSRVLDEMSIAPDQQFDPSTQSYYGITTR